MPDIKLTEEQKAAWRLLLLLQQTYSLAEALRQFAIHIAKEQREEHQITVGGVPYMVFPNSDFLNKATYLREMSQPGAWGDQLMADLIAHTLGYGVQVQASGYDAKTKKSYAYTGTTLPSQDTGLGEVVLVNLNSTHWKLPDYEPAHDGSCLFSSMAHRIQQDIPAVNKALAASAQTVTPVLAQAEPVDDKSIKSVQSLFFTQVSDIQEPVVLPHRCAIEHYTPAVSISHDPAERFNVAFGLLVELHDLDRLLLLCEAARKLSPQMIARYLDMRMTQTEALNRDRAQDKRSTDNLAIFDALACVLNGDHPDLLKAHNTEVVRGEIINMLALEAQDNPSAFNKMMELFSPNASDQAQETQLYNRTSISVC